MKDIAWLGPGLRMIFFGRSCRVTLRNRGVRQEANRLKPTTNGATVAEEVAQPEPRAEDVATIDGIIAAYYEVVSGPPVRVQIMERDRSLHHPDAWVAIANVDSTGQPFVNLMALDGYYGGNPPRPGGILGVGNRPGRQRSGNMAHVWSSYATAREQGGEPYTHGVNTITCCTTVNVGGSWVGCSMSRPVSRRHRFNMSS